MYKNIVKDFGPHPKYPEGLLSSDGVGYRPWSVKSGFPTIDFPGGVKVKFPFGIKAQ